MRKHMWVVTLIMLVTIIPMATAMAESFYIDDSAAWTTTDTNSQASVQEISTTLRSPAGRVTATSSLSGMSNQTSIASGNLNTGYRAVRHYYDDLDRLKWSQYEDGTVIAYAYDKVGNRIEQNIYIGELANSLTVTATVTGYGSLVPSGTLNIPSGNSQTFFLEPGPLPLTGALLMLMVDNEVLDLGALPSIQGPSGPRYYYTLSNITGNHAVNAIFAGGSSGADPVLCSYYPARLANAQPAYFSALQDAYDSALDGAIIQGNANDHMENLHLMRSISVTLDGAYTCDYTAKTGNLSLKGEIVIGNGSLAIADSTVVLKNP